ncbi:osteoclast stimulatory transmembrane protein isoform X1 [Astyanax mexicanus]|uniref:osteoclast stimulatory transmembrane protein isoform X1 n=2 Tax=Astyanax mexicanus TaxID=7994 RepID=UPI0020CAFFD4|nr:osteoclast stimulatory transmembrane protein isoform X1 [Astyanax mexicanus]
MSLQNIRHKFRRLVRWNLMEFLWFSYSTPSPQSTTQLITLLLLCLAISAGTGALLYRWLSDLLMYTRRTALISAGVYAAAMFFSSLLVHPLRCVFTLMFPTLGTRQGRKLVLSVCAMIVVLEVLPNIAANIATITHLMKCTSENLAHSLLNSSQLCNSIKSNMVEQVRFVKHDSISLDQKFQTFNHSTQINVAEMRGRLNNLSRHVEEDFSRAKRQLEDLKLLSSRVFAAVLVVYLFADSAAYLKSYLTSARFDNIYITGLLRRTAADKGIPAVGAKDVKNGVNSTGFRITRRELIRCLVPVLMITLYLLITIMLLMLDRIVLYLVVTGQTWLSEVPSTKITIQANLKVNYFSSLCELFSCSGSMLRNDTKTYTAIVGSEAAQCSAQPHELDPNHLVLLGLLYLASYSLAFLEVYARRLRRKVASSFFQQQEEKRIDFLIEKILKKRESLKREEEEKKMEGSEVIEPVDQPEPELYKFYKLQETSGV